MRPPHEAGEVFVGFGLINFRDASSMRPPHEAGEVRRAPAIPTRAVAFFNEAPARGGGGPGRSDPSCQCAEVFNEAPARGGGGRGRP